ncbi:MAG: mechanosensitive ion channel [Bacteroidota bacterium]|nr:mechanosensitive ion channel [Bacteroidota bacterium]
MAQIEKIINSILDFFNMTLFTLGKTHVSVWTIIYVVAASFLLFWLTGRLNNLLVYRVMSRSKIDIGTRAALGSFIRYFVLTIGFIVLLQTAGINLSSLTVLLGALGVGIGFGLQTITNNLISGLIIFIERPIKVGDRIEVSEVEGNVTDISMRATEILTNDNISIIVPNSEFISKTVINWSHSDRNVRFNFPVAVSYRENADRVRDVLKEVAMQEEAVLKNPPPDVLIREFSDSAITFNLRVWTSDMTDRPGVLKSRLYYAITRSFREHGIEFPFPQRDLHIKEMPAQSTRGEED